MTSLEKLAIRGTVWTFVGFGLSRSLRLIGNLILTRLLTPEMFGLMALVQTFLTGLALFSDIGIRPSIIQNKRGEDPPFYNTAWTMQVFRGIGVWICCFLIAFPVSQFYQEPRLLWLIPVVGATSVINGFDSTALAMLNRKVAIAKLTVFEAGVQTISLVVMVVWAAIQQTIWALVGGNLVSSLVKLIWSHRLDPKISNRFAWDKTAVKELTSFGQWIFISTAMTFLATQADRLILGKLFSLEMLGVYTVAFTFADLPNAIISQVNGRVIFPVISKKADLPREELRAKILQKRWMLMLGLAIGIAVLSGFGDLLVLSLYDARYKDAAWMLSILTLGIWPLAVSRTVGSTLLAVGKPLYGAIGFFLKFVYMLIALPLGFAHMGVFGAILVIALNDLPYYAAVNYGAWREKLTSTAQDALGTLILAGLFVLICVVRSFVGLGLPFDGIA